MRTKKAVELVANSLKPVAYLAAEFRWTEDQFADVARFLFRNARDEEFRRRSHEFLTRGDEPRYARPGPGWLATCPVCERTAIYPTRVNTMSMTVYCRGCDSSLGVNALSLGVSVVYTEVPEENWVPEEEE